MSIVVQSIRSALFAALCVAATSAQSQYAPTKPVRLVVPFAAGGTIDVMARTFGQKLTEIWKQQVLVDNRGGAGGTIGADLVAKSPPNGHTLLLHSVAQAISPVDAAIGRRSAAWPAIQRLG